MNELPPAQLLAEVEDVLRTMPPPDSFGTDTPEHFAWLGRASSVVHAWDPIKAIARFDGHVGMMNSRLGKEVQVGARAVLTMLHQIRHDLRMRTQSSQSVNVDAGGVFDYFDEIRKVIETAKQDILFVDPYLDAEFVSRYLRTFAPAYRSGSSHGSAFRCFFQQSRYCGNSRVRQLTFARH